MVNITEVLKISRLLTPEHQAELLNCIRLAYIAENASFAQPAQSSHTASMINTAAQFPVRNNEGLNPVLSG